MSLYACIERRLGGKPPGSTLASSSRGAPVAAHRRAQLAIAGAALTVLLAGCEQHSMLVSQVTARDAYEIQGVLADAGIGAVPSAAGDNRLDIAVDTAHEADARRILKENGLPRPQFESLVDVFGKDGIVSSPFEEQARFLYATSQGLEDTLRNFDGVVFAKVHIVLPEKKSLVRGGVAASASVFVKYRPMSNVAALTPAIQRLVANAIPGLPPEHVEVIATAAADHADQARARQALLQHGAALRADAARLYAPRPQSALVFVGGALIGALAVLLLGALGIWRVGRVCARGGRWLQQRRAGVAQAWQRRRRA